MKKPVNQLIRVVWAKQLSLLLCLSIILSLVDIVIAYSVLVGGLLYWGPNVYFTRLVFRYSAEQYPDPVLQNFYRGEVGKFLLTATGFALAFVFVKPLSPLAVLIAYLGMTFSQWFFVSRW